MYYNDIKTLKKYSFEAKKIFQKNFKNTKKT
jgi:hypothetical protein